MPTRDLKLVLADIHNINFQGTFDLAEIKALGEAAKLITSSVSYYELLGLNRDASEADIKNHYREMSLRFHPDKTGERDGGPKTEIFKIIQNAYETLSDPERKNAYDNNQRQSIPPAPTRTTSNTQHYQLSPLLSAAYSNNWEAVKLILQNNSNFATQLRQSGLIRTGNVFHSEIIDAFDNSVLDDFNKTITAAVYNCPHPTKQDIVRLILNQLVRVTPTDDVRQVLRQDDFAWWNHGRGNIAVRKYIAQNLGAFKQHLITLHPGMKFRAVYDIDPLLTERMDVFRIFQDHLLGLVEQNPIEFSKAFECCDMPHYETVAFPTSVYGRLAVALTREAIRVYRANKSDGGFWTWSSSNSKKIIAQLEAVITGTVNESEKNRAIFQIITQEGHNAGERLRPILRDHKLTSNPKEYCIKLFSKLYPQNAAAPAQSSAQQLTANG